MKKNSMLITFVAILSVQLWTWAASGTGATVGGGLSNNASGAYSTVGGGYSNTASNYETTVAGGYGNTAAGYCAAVAGGYFNVANGSYSTVAGGYGNVGGTYVTVGGGYLNAAFGNVATVAGGYQNKANGYCATIGGGWSNSTVGQYATIAGGGPYDANNPTTTNNKTLDDYCAVGGGGGNVAGAGGGISAFATVAGGYANNASGAYSTVGGGASNNASNDYAMVAGGEYNTAGGECATVGGGQFNTASYLYATVSGGYENSASGMYATVPGGTNNHASGQGSFAAGTSANASNDGCFVWADSTGTVLSSTATNQFLVRAIGGVYFYTSATAGAKLASGSTSWTVLSDRNQKANITPVTPSEVLQKVAHLPVSTWNYKAQDPSIRHMGPMAQDLYAAFSLGEGDTGIDTVDADGVALAAIQGLNQKVQDQAATIAGQTATIAQLRTSLDASVSVSAAKSAKLESEVAELKAMMKRMAAKS